MGVVHKPHPGWATHIPVLIKCLELTSGPVLELGLGDMSTPLMHTLCAADDRWLVSYDNDGRFIERFKNFDTGKHEITLLEDWKYAELWWGWSVALVDHKPGERRKEDVKRLVHAEYVIIHDSNSTDEFYGFEEIYPLFKYRYDYTKFANQTTVLSNKHDVNKLLNTLG